MNDRIASRKEIIEQQKAQLENRINDRNDGRTVSLIMRRLLLVIMAIAFIGSVSAVWILHTHIAEQNMRRILRQNLEDVRQDITEASDDSMKYLAMYVASSLDNPEGYRTEHYREYLENRDLEECEHSLLLYLAELLELSEAMAVDGNGIVTDSTEASFIGFDLSSGDRSAEFLRLLDGKTETLVQEYGPVSGDSGVFRKLAGAALSGREGFVLVTYNEEQVQEDVAYQVDSITNNRHVGAAGCVIIADNTGRIVSGTDELYGKTIEDAGFSIPEEIVENTMLSQKLNGTMCRYMVSVVEGFCVVAVIPEAEFEGARDLTVAVLALIELITFVNLYFSLSRMLKREVADKLKAVTAALDKITDGNMDEAVNVRGNREFLALSKDINEMVDSLKNCMEAEKKRIEQELEYAKEIQLSALPNTFPPYPDHTGEFDIYAEMTPAREVGGDFYDFFLLDNDRLVLLVADVSGKGIPASLFMMRAKSLIKTACTDSRDPGTVFGRVNNILCEGNSSDMFVTCWIGIIDLKTGSLEFANAGHNIPLLRRAGGQYDYLRQKTNFVLAGMSGARYFTQKLQLNHGDELFLYTDGVPEATDTALELYGDERLKIRLNSRRYLTSAMEICRSVHADVDNFVGEASQFDDMTLLSFQYL